MRAPNSSAGRLLLDSVRYPPMVVLAAATKGGLAISPWRTVLAYPALLHSLLPANLPSHPIPSHPIPTRAINLTRRRAERNLAISPGLVALVTPVRPHGCFPLACRRPPRSTAHALPCRAGAMPIAMIAQSFTACQPPTLGLLSRTGPITVRLLSHGP